MRTELDQGFLPASRNALSLSLRIDDDGLFFGSTRLMRRARQIRSGAAARPRRERSPERPMGQGRPHVLGASDETPKAAVDEPKLFPAPTPDKGHGATPAATAYEQLVHERVNPIAPLSPELAVNPLTGKEVNFDDCFRYEGDLIDGDMKPGDLADAKGPTYEFLLAQSWSTTLQQLTDRAVIQLRTADARGVGLKWYFAEQGAADKVREAFSRSDLKRIVIGYMPPR